MTPAAPVEPWRKAGFAALLLAYFLAVSRDTWKTGFSSDEMMAIHTYWHPSPWRLLTSQFLMWRGYFRPMGALFYIPNFLAFGLNPVPYHIALLALLLAGVVHDVSPRARPGVQRTGGGNRGADRLLSRRPEQPVLSERLRL